ncbi:MAG: hypothetical protein LBK83_11490 [Treponema sp.]|jgi:hypothetical protein|nr:hypothetical protein [Treponema sp.]
MTDKGTENTLKQAAIQDFCSAVRRQDRSVISMAYDADNEAVQIRHTCGSVVVDVLGKTIIGMLAVVLNEVGE